MIADSFNGSSSPDLESESPTVAPVCIVCGQAAVGVGPFSSCRLCQEHLSVDVADAHRLKDEVANQLRAYSQGLQLGADPTSLRLQFEQKLQQIEQRFTQVQRDLDSFRTSVRGPLESVIEAVLVCERDQEDIFSYKQEVATAEAEAKISDVIHLALSMQLSLGDLETDFKKATRLQREQSDSAEQQLRLLVQLEKPVGRCASCAKARLCSTAKSALRDTAEGANRSAFDLIFSHEVKLDAEVAWLAVCSDTSGFSCDLSGRVVRGIPKRCSEALPQPCVIASLWPNKDHLLLLSVSGSSKWRCHCDIEWNKEICGLYCDRQLLFIAQRDAVTVTDLSGQKVLKISPRIKGFGDIGGIGGNSASVFVSSGNKIAAFSWATGQMETVIRLSRLSGAQLGNLTIHDNWIFVTDLKDNQVHRVRIDTQQLVATYPTRHSGLEMFSGLRSLAVDSRGRLFVSESWGHSVRAVAADSGSLLGTFRTEDFPPAPAKKCGRIFKTFYYPSGLAVVKVGQFEKLFVPKFISNQLLVFDI